MPAQVQPPKESAILERANVENAAAYFAECDQMRALLQDTYIVVPVRPADGVNCTLTRRLATWYGEGTAFSLLNDHMGGFIQETRANIAYTFLSEPPMKPDGTPCNYLLMIDNDMEPRLDMVNKLVRHQKQVVGVCAMSVDQDYGPQLCFTVKSEDGKYRMPSLAAQLALPASGLVEVGHVGTGALLIRRDVLQAFSFEGEDVPFMVPEEFRKLGMKTGTLTIGEDIAFCNQLRAKGIPMHVDLEVHVGHRKTMVLSWDDAMRDPYLDAARWVLPNIGKNIVSL